jgi:hypothetical protein
MWTVHIVHKANRGPLPGVGSPHDPRGWRLAAGGWRLAAGGWRLAAGSMRGRGGRAERMGQR